LTGTHEYHKSLNKKATKEAKPSGRQGSLNLDFEMAVINRINKKITELEIDPNDYYDRLLAFKNNKFETKLTRLEFHKSMNGEGYNYSPEELDYIFYMLDKSNDDKLDRDEFTSAIKRVYRALTQVKEFISKNKLTPQEIYRKMNIDISRNEILDFTKFKTSNNYLI
jgi:hypothetical protein